MVQCTKCFRFLSGARLPLFSKEESAVENRGYKFHGLSNTPLYKRWKNMKSRCSNLKTPYYGYYGGRGVGYCEDWNLFENFYQWAVGSGYSEELTLDRIDNDKGYSPENCRWTTRSVQLRNTRKLRTNNTSGYRGVSKDKEAKTNPWKASIGVNSTLITLGRFPSPELAAKAYDNYVVKNSLEHTLNFSQPEKG